MTLAQSGPGSPGYSLQFLFLRARDAPHTRDAHLRSEILCARRPVLTSAFLLNRARNITQGPGCDGLLCFGARRRQGRQLGRATLGSIFITRKQKENASRAEIIKDALGK